MKTFALNFPLQRNILSHRQTYHRPTEQEAEIESNYIDKDDNYIPSELFEHDNKDEEEFYGGVTTEMLEMEVTTLLPTTTTVETTTVPISEFRVSSDYEHSFSICYLIVD